VYGSVLQDDGDIKVYVPVYKLGV